MKRIIITAIGYVMIVFPLAIVWHLVLFQEIYTTFGYFSGTPNVLVGLSSIIIQGVMLATIFPLFHTGRAGFARAFQFSAMIGAFFWTSHVLALVAKQNVPNALTFIAMETGYLVLQFGLFALLIGAQYRGEK